MFLLWVPVCVLQVRVGVHTGRSTCTNPFHIHQLISRLQAACDMSICWPTIAAFKGPCFFFGGPFQLWPLYISGWFFNLQKKSQECSGLCSMHCHFCVTKGNTWTETPTEWGRYTHKGRECACKTHPFYIPLCKLRKICWNLLSNDRFL